MAINVGDRLPSVKLKELTADGIQDVSTDELFKGKKGVLFAVPGAFTPTCSAKHVPSFVGNDEKLRAKGIEVVACVAVNDAFVMEAWGKQQNAAGKVRMLADGNAELAKALGLDSDMTKFGLGVRSQRYAMIVEDGVIKTLNVEQPGAFEVSSGEAMLAAL